ncbi:phosphatase PAP2 family protein [Pontibacter flavimaris]|uniref:Phosphoesterase n=1 Tax=Pontibacter flavimaris TaxID=1797110 RepID=A0A1Q5PFT6_9BACT|nr:phosphatase PAP2 family protein [Pontibacter flavimaris]OKL41108.1 phosphoesterase [Pontibacter flavimaris]
MRKQHILVDKARRVAGWLLRRPVVVRLRQRFPQTTSFIANRLHTGRFVGLPLTLIILTALLNMMLLSNLAESVVEAEWVVQVDKKFNILLYGIRSEGLSQALYTVTWLGDRQAVFVLGGLATAVLLFRRQWFSIVAYWLAMGGVGLSVRFGKTIISRARPQQDMAYYLVDHFSFPSGHATTSLVLIGMLAYLLYRHLQAAWQRRLVVALALLLIGLVGFSRMYLGVHYLSDVVAGYLLGILWLLVGISLVEVLEYNRRRHDNLPLP